MYSCLCCFFQHVSITNLFTRQPPIHQLGLHLDITFSIEPMWLPHTEFCMPFFVFLLQSYYIIMTMNTFNYAVLYNLWHMAWVIYIYIRVIYVYYIYCILYIVYSYYPFIIQLYTLYTIIYITYMDLYPYICICI